MAETLYGETQARRVAKMIFRAVADTTSAGLAGIPPEDRYDGMLCVVGTGTTTFHLWWYVATSVAGASGTVVVPTDAPAAGRWVQAV